MGDTFNAFVKFISDDPIMLGLCVAIIVLVVLFIIVLLVGKGKDTGKETVSEIDKTTELLKTDINLDTLKSTQEFSVANMDKNEEVFLEESASIEPVKKITPVEERETISLNNELTIEPTPIEDMSSNTQGEVPIVEPVSFEEQSMVTSPEPVVEPTIVNAYEQTIDPVNTPTVESIEVPVETSVAEPLEINLPSEPQENIKLPSEVSPYIDPFNIQTPNVAYNENNNNNSSIVESSVAPLEERESLTSILNEINSQPQITNEVEIDAHPSESEIGELPKEPPFSPVYAPNEQVSNAGVDDNYGQTVINMPVMEGFNSDSDNIFDKVEQPEPPKVEEEDYDDLELPKLISSESNDTFLQDIKGESFNI